MPKTVFLLFPPSAIIESYQKPLSIHINGIISEKQFRLSGLILVHSRTVSCTRACGGHDSLDRWKKKRGYEQWRLWDGAVTLNLCVTNQTNVAIYRNIYKHVQYCNPRNLHFNYKVAQRLRNTATKLELFFQGKTLRHVMRFLSETHFAWTQLRGRFR